MPLASEAGYDPTLRCRHPNSSTDPSRPLPASMPNRLAHELSPYLLQHADNPVEWFPWGDEAFAAARNGDKPIFLSIGYSTCHWCHVMERESFEDRDIAATLNRDFVSIKVDREERPDVDRVYMAFVQATTGSGGWPMSVWLTSDLKPFFGGTYFPPTSRYGRPGFVDVLTRLSELWTEDRQQLVRSADDVIEKLRVVHATPSGPGESGAPRLPPVETLAEGRRHFIESFDTVHAGFGSAPKFPRPSELTFLLREHARTGDAGLRDIVTRTLAAMADGGMRDHLGGGFHRYSVDAAWRIPHFEKMLYDQAQLVVAYLEAGQSLGDDEFLRVASDTLRYVARDLTGVAGGFLSAEDADSVPPNGLDPSEASDKSAVTTTPVEGAFYLWSQAELDRRLGDDASLVAARFGVEAAGNAPQDPTGEFSGLNQFYLAKSLGAIASDLNLPVAAVTGRVTRACATLLDARRGRPRPPLDDKVLAAWNGLMIGAAARAAHVVESEALSALRMATQAATFVRGALWDGTREVLQRRYRDGHASLDGFCEDYAFMVWGVLELFQTTGDPQWLLWARTLQRRQNELFWDDQGGGWFSTTGQDSSVLLRVKDEYDGAEPSAGSVSVLNLLTMLHLFNDDDDRARIEATLARFGPRMNQAVRIVPLMATALAQFHAGLSQVVVVGKPGSEDTHRLTRCVASHYLPFAVRLVVEPGARQETLAEQLPFVRSLTMRDGRATAYVCANFACREPVTDPSALAAELRLLNEPHGDGH